jgi:hypothetical protein
MYLTRIFRDDRKDRVSARSDGERADALPDDERFDKRTEKLAGRE